MEYARWKFNPCKFCNKCVLILLYTLNVPNALNVWKMTKEWVSTFIFYGVPLGPSRFFFSNLKSLKHENTNTRKYEYENTNTRKYEDENTNTRNQQDKNSKKGWQKRENTKYLQVDNYRGFVIVLSYFPHRTFLFSSSYFLVFVIVLWIHVSTCWDYLINTRWP